MYDTRFCLLLLLLLLSLLLLRLRLRLRLPRVDDVLLLIVTYYCKFANGSMPEGRVFYRKISY